MRCPYDTEPEKPGATFSGGDVEASYQAFLVRRGGGDCDRIRADRGRHRARDHCRGQWARYDPEYPVHLDQQLSQVTAGGARFLRAAPEFPLTGAAWRRFRHAGRFSTRASTACSILVNRAPQPSTPSIRLVRRASGASAAGFGMAGFEINNVLNVPVRKKSTAGVQRAIHLA